MLVSSYFVCLTGFLDVVRSNNNSGVFLLGNLNEMIPDAVAEDRIQADRWFVQDEQLWLVHHRRRKGHATLLPTAAVFQLPADVQSAQLY